MEIVRSSSTTGLEPEAAAALNAYLTVPSEHRRYESRRPLAAYNVSLARVLPRFLDVLAELERVTSARAFEASDPGTWGETLIARHESLLYAINEHFEDCLRIIASFLPATVKPNKHAAVQQYKGAVKDLRDFVATVVNRVKHHQRRLRSLVVFENHIAVPGYFVEGVDETESIVPDPPVHDSRAEAFSNFRELRLHFFTLYAIGHHLATAVDGILSRNDRVPPTDTWTAEHAWTTALRLQALPAQVLFCELGLPFAAVHAADRETERTIRCEYPQRQVRLVAPGRARVLVDMRGDGVSREFKLPLLGKARLP